MYVRELDGQELTFQVSGKLWMRSLIMYDAETRSEWSHLLGRAMAGQLKGKKLKPLITDMVTWSVWKKQHPDTTVLNMSRTDRNYTKDFYLKPSRFLFGFHVSDKHFALPMPLMMDHPVFAFEAADTQLVATFEKEGAVTHLFESNLEGQTLTFEHLDNSIMKDRETESRWEMLSGKCIDGKLKGKMLQQRVGIMSFRKAWENFHPDSIDIQP